MGADLNSSDSKNRKPIDIAINRKNNNLIGILRDSISINSCKFVTGKAEDNDIFPYIFYGYFTFNEMFNMLVPLPFIGSYMGIGISFLSYITLLIIYSYLIKYSEPGFMNSKNTIKKLLDEEANLNEFCAICTCFTRYTTHCYYCNKCVEYIDHHCIWIKKCVSKKNVNHFFLFLLWTCLKLLLTVAFSLYSKF